MFTLPVHQVSISQEVVNVKLIVSYDVTMLFLVVTSLITINSTLTTFCEIDARSMLPIFIGAQLAHLLLLLRIFLVIS